MNFLKKAKNFVIPSKIGKISRKQQKKAGEQREKRLKKQAKTVIIRECEMSSQPYGNDGGGFGRFQIQYRRIL